MTKVAKYISYQIFFTKNEPSASFSFIFGRFEQEFYIKMKLDPVSGYKLATSSLRN